MCNQFEKSNRWTARFEEGIDGENIEIFIHKCKFKAFGILFMQAWFIIVDRKSEETLHWQSIQIDDGLWNDASKL